MAQSKRKPNIAAPASIAEDSPTDPRVWLALIVLGILLRLALAAVSIGTNDAAAWLRFGDEINQHGLLQTYKIDPDFNHPPIPGYWAALCAKLAGNPDAPLHDSIFTNLFKLAPLAGDCLAMYVLVLIWRRARDRTFALFVAAMFALNLDAIVVTGFHCNTDPLLIALCLLCLYLFDDRPLLSGLALSAAINVKIIPVLLIFPLFMQIRSWRAFAMFFGGLAIGVIPFIPPLLTVRGSFISNAVQYNSVLDRWGINYFLLLDGSSDVGKKLILGYYAKARYLILGVIAVWAIVARLGPRRAPAEVALVTFSIFLVLAPGFGVQYSVLTGLLIFALRPRWGIVYGISAGLFVSTAYFVNLKDTFPLYAHWSALFPDPVALLGIATWIILIALTIFSFVRPAAHLGAEARSLSVVANT